MALLSACCLLLGSLRLGSRNGNGATHCPLLSRQNSLSIMARNSLSSTDSPGLSSSWDVWKMFCPIGPFLCGCLKIASPCICLGRSSLTMILFGQGVDKVDLPSYITATLFATTTSGLLVLPRQTSPTITHPSLSFWWSIRRSNALLNYVMCITKVTSNQEKNVNWMSWTVTSEALFSGELCQVLYHVVTCSYWLSWLFDVLRWERIVGFVALLFVPITHLVQLIKWYIVTQCSSDRGMFTNIVCCVFTFYLSQGIIKTRKMLFW